MNKKSNGGTILIVDDIPENLQLLIDILGEYDYQVRPASDGEFAINYAVSDQPDLILLDIRMPGLNGLEVCRRLKERHETADIPIIFISAADDISDIRKGFEAGGVDYITKPFNDEEVVVRVKTHLAIQKLKEDLKTKNTALEQALERERRMVEDLRLNLSLSLPHELRTPLNGILGFSELLSRLTELPELDEVVKYGKTIYKSGKRLYRLVENSLLYADLKLINYTAKNGKIIQTNEMVTNAKEFIEDLAREQAKIAERENDYVLDGDNISIAVKPENLKKITVELLSNAFKFSPPGTPVRLNIKKTDDGNVIEVSDRGSGMDSEQLKSIGAYMQFNRGKQAQQGMGMGLAIAALMAKAENGDLEIDSKPGEGTSCRVILP